MSLKKLTFSLVLLFAITGAAASDKTGRRLASVSPGDSLTAGQGEQMLRTVKRSSPGFLKPASTASNSVRLVGVCRDAYGYANVSVDRGYANCLEAANNRSGASVHDYFGPGQRQTGLGFRVGN